MKRWYVVQTQPNNEARAVRHLERQEFEPYLPLYLKTRRHARKIDRVARPLFPRYLFVKLDPARERWRSVNGTFGVNCVLTDGHMPVPVPEGIVEGIQARHNEQGLVALDAPVFHPGQRLEIVEGALAMHTALFQHVSDHERVVLLLDLLGRKVRVTVPAISVAAA
jgi:transcriptional antiterminator RfaH